MNNFPDFRLAFGGRPNIFVPDAQWLVGDRTHPFRVGCTLTNGAVTNSDLTTQDAWYEDVQVRKAYTPSNGSSTKLRAMLTVEALRLYVSSSVFSALLATVKDDATAQMFASFNIGGQEKLVDLRGCLREGPKEFQVTQATAADGNHWLLDGGWARIPSGPVTVDLEQNSFKLETLNTPAFGADITQCWVEIIGFMCPKGAPGAVPFVPGNCPPGLVNSRGQRIPGGLSSPNDIIQFATGPATLSRLPGS